MLFTSESNLTVLFNMSSNLIQWYHSRIIFMIWTIRISAESVWWCCGSCLHAKFYLSSWPVPIRQLWI